MLYEVFSNTLNTKMGVVEYGEILNSITGCEVSHQTKGLYCQDFISLTFSVKFIMLYFLI